MTAPGGLSVEQISSPEAKERLGISAISFEGLVFLVHNLDCADEQEKKEIVDFAFDSGAYHLLLTHFKLLDDGSKKKVATYLQETNAVSAILAHAEVLKTWINWGKVFDVLTRPKGSDWKWSDYCMSKQHPVLCKPEGNIRTNGIDYELLFRFRSLFEAVSKNWYANHIQHLIDTEQYLALFELVPLLLNSDNIPWPDVLQKAKENNLDLSDNYLIRSRLLAFRSQFPQYAELMAKTLNINEKPSTKHPDNDSDPDYWTQFIVPLLQPPFPYNELSYHLPDMLTHLDELATQEGLDWDKLIRAWIRQPLTRFSRPGHREEPSTLLPYGDRLAQLSIDWNQLAIDYEFPSSVHLRNRIGFLLCIAHKTHLLSPQFQFPCEQSLFYTLQPPHEKVALSWNIKDPLNEYDLESSSTEDRKGIVMSLFYSHRFEDLQRMCNSDPRVRSIVTQIISEQIPDIEWIIRLKVLIKHNLQQAAERLAMFCQYLLKIGTDSPAVNVQPYKDSVNRDSFMSLPIAERVASFYINQFVLFEKHKVTKSKLKSHPSSSGLWTEAQEFSTTRTNIEFQSLQSEVVRQTQQFFTELKEYLLCAIDHELRNQSTVVYYEQDQPLDGINNNHFSPALRLWNVGQAMYVSGESAEQIQEFLVLAEAQFMNPRWNAEYAGEKWALIAQIARDMWRKSNTLQDQLVAIDRCISIQHNNGAIFDKDDRIPKITGLQPFLDFCFKNNSVDDLIQYVRSKDILPETELQQYEQRFALLQRLGSPQTPTRAAGYE